MEDVHGKEVPLQCVTVKLPGQKPRGSKTILPTSSSTSAASSLAEGLGNLAMGGKWLTNLIEGESSNSSLF